MSKQDDAQHQAEVLDVQLLDVLAQVEAVLRHGREIQREALRVRGVASPSSEAQRHASGTLIRERVDEMHKDCNILCHVVDELRLASQKFARLLAS